METVLISALEHWSYCPRQCGLIHLESVWDENVFTIRGQAVHERADEPITRTERGRRVERALPIWTERYRLQGRADLVEFLPDGTPVPVEYKSGKAHEDNHAEIQLCAQAFCLEEMFHRSVNEGAIFFAASQRRESVALDDALRQRTARTIEDVRRMLEDQVVPPPVSDRRCRNCSLADACLSYSLVAASTVETASAFRPLRERDLP